MKPPFGNLRKGLREARGQDLGRLAVLYGYLTEEQLESALEKQGNFPGAPGLGKILIESGHLTEDQVVELLHSEKWYEGRETPPTKFDEDPEAVHLARKDPKNHLGRYLLVEKIGKGGTSVVWKGWDDELSRWVAVKIMAKDRGTSRPRFLREAHAAGTLRHPNLVTVHDVGEHEGNLFIVMEYISGNPLDVTQDLEKTVRLLHTSARAIHHAHRQGIVHRDLKPGNIMVDEEGSPLVVDFGLARLEDNSKRITHEGTLVGTPYYMAPEQIGEKGSNIDGRTDVYALGVILYEAIAGRAPFRADSLLGIFEAIQNRDPKAPGGPKDLEAVCLKAIEKNPGNRYPTAAAFAEELERYLSDEPVLARRQSILRRASRHKRSLGVVAALVLAAVAFLAWRQFGPIDPAEARAAMLADLPPTWNGMMEAREYLGEKTGDPVILREKFGDAIRAAKAFTDKHPDQPHGWYIQARAHFMLGHIRKAKKALVQCLDRNDDFSPAHLLLARVGVTEFRWTTWDLGNNDLSKYPSLEKLYRETSQIIRKALHDRIKVHPGAWDFPPSPFDTLDPVLHEMLIVGWVDRDREKALRDLDEANGKDPRAEYCAYLEDLGGKENQLKWTNRRIELRPLSAEAHLNRGLILAFWGKTEEAFRELERAIEIHPGFALAFSSRAVVRNNTGGNKSEIVRDCDRAIDLNPGLFRPWYIRGWVKLNKRDFMGAIPDFDEAEQLVPYDAPVHRDRGSARIRLEQWEEAISDFTRAIELDGNDPISYWSRGFARGKKKALGEAKQDVEKALRIAPADWFYREAAEKFLDDLRSQEE